MVRAGVDADFDGRARGDGLGRVAGVELVAPDVAGGHVADEAVVLPVLGLADDGPGSGAVDAGERVWGSDQHLRGGHGDAAGRERTVRAGRRDGYQEDGECLHCEEDGWVEG